MLSTRQGYPRSQRYKQEVKLKGNARNCKRFARHCGLTVGWQMYVKGFGALLNRIRVRVAGNAN